MLTRKELCQCILVKAQQKFGKPMTELDVYYAGADVGLALDFLGCIKDRNLAEYTKNNKGTLYKHINGKELTYADLINILPETEVSTKPIKNQLRIEGDVTLTEDQIKNALGERKYYRLLDAFEHLNTDDLGFVLHLLKEKLLSCLNEVL